MDWIPHPLVVEEPTVLRNYYQLKSQWGYCRDWEFLQVLLSVFQSQLPTETEVKISTDQDNATGVVEEGEGIIKLEDGVSVGYSNPGMDLSHRLWCAQCGISFYGLFAFQKHNCKKEIAEELSCNRCKEAFHDYVDYDQHMQTLHANFEGMPCTKCHRTYYSKSALVSHRKKAHREMKAESWSAKNHDYVCCLCTNVKFISSDQLIDHFQQLHPDEKPFCCMSCDTSFFSFVELNEHKTKFSDEGHRKCEQCTEIFSNESFYSDHKLSCVPDLLSCGHCLQKNFNSETLRNHMIECSATFKRSKDHDETALIETSLSVQNIHANENCEAVVKTTGTSIKSVDKNECQKKHKDDPKLVFQCHICLGAEGDFNLFQLDQHFKSLHAEEKPFKCFCDETFTLFDDFQAHKSQLRHIGKFSCEVCGEVFYKKSSLHKHMGNARGHSKKVVGASTFADTTDMKDSTLGNDPCCVELGQCNKCGMRCVCQKEKPGSKAGISTNDKCEGSRFQCEICDKTYKSLYVLNDHRGTHQGLLFTCHICQTQTKTRIRLKKHILNVHTTKAKRTCKECGKVYKKLYNLLSHMAKVHPKPGQVAPVSKRYKCDVCGKKYANVTFLKDHKESHGDVSFICLICKKPCRTRLTLKCHMKSVHNDAPKTHICEVCGNAYRTINQLKRHVGVHDTNRKRNISCDKCDKTFLTKNHYNIHVIRSHGDMPKNFVCEICSKAFSANSILQNHLRTHTGERPFKCPICNDDFNHTGALYTHVKLKHKGKKISLRHGVLDYPLNMNLT